MANRQMNEQLDRAGKLVLLAAVANETETEAAASSPFLYTRLRAAITEERRRAEAGGWLSLLFVARRAVPAMALIAALAAVLTLWSPQLGAPANNIGFDDEAFFDARENGIEQSILAGNNSLSRDEVFGIVVDQNEREKR